MAVLKTNALASRTALLAVATLAKGIANYGSQVSDHAPVGNIYYSVTDPILKAGSPSVPVTLTREGYVTGNIVAEAAKQANGTCAAGTVAVMADGANGTAAQTELGHRYTIKNVTGAGGGWNEAQASPTPGGASGNAARSAITPR